MQQIFHEKLLAGEFELAFEVGPIAQLLVFRSFRHEDHVRDELHQVVLLGFGRHCRNLAGLILGDSKIALVDFNTVDLGDNRVLVLGSYWPSRHDEERQKCGIKAGLTRTDR